MADLNRYQQKVVQRYYRSLDARTIQTLGEIVSDLYLAEGKAADRLWSRADTALQKTDLPAAKRVQIVNTKDIKGFAEVVAKLSK